MKVSLEELLKVQREKSSIDLISEALGDTLEAFSHLVLAVAAKLTKSKGSGLI